MDSSQGKLGAINYVLSKCRLAVYDSITTDKNDRISGNDIIVLLLTALNDIDDIVNTKDKFMSHTEILNMLTSYIANVISDTQERVDRTLENGEGCEAAMLTYESALLEISRLITSVGEAK